MGCDQLIVLISPLDSRADVRLQIYNADGRETQACGNGTRCVARFLMEEEKDEIFIETAGTVCNARWASFDFNESEPLISLTLGVPRFDWQHIPLASFDALQKVSYDTIIPFCVNVGNPHAIFFVKDVADVPLGSVGPQIETHPAFLEGINVGFAEIIDKRTIRLRVWERGAGYTMACGTGACAAAVMAIDQKFMTGDASSFVKVIQDGGEILVHWQEGHPIRMIGSAQICFRGEIEI